MNVLLFGYGEVGCAALEFLQSVGDCVAAVVTHRDDSGERRWFRSLAELAGRSGIETFTSEDLGNDGLARLARAVGPDLILSAFYRRLIPMDALAAAHLGALNLHASLLPRLRGRAPIHWALVDLEERTGVTLHHMVAEPDAGDIVAQRGFDIGPRDTAPDLYRRVLAEERLLLEEIWPLVRAGAAPRRPQDHSRATVRGRRRPEDGRIDWSEPARRIDGLVRAVTEPFPGAFTFCGGRKVMVWSGEPINGRGRPGEVIAPSVVATGSGAYRAIRCEFDGPDREPLVVVPGMRFGDGR